MRNKFNIKLPITRLIIIIGPPIIIIIPYCGIVYFIITLGSKNFKQITIFQYIIGEIVFIFLLFIEMYVLNCRIVK